MANALSNIITPPPAPNPQPQDEASGNALTQAPAQAPAPTHAQTVAALRHFNAVIREVEVLLKNPDLGKADMKSAIIDGVTKLVSDRIIPPAVAVQQLGKVPERPFEQKQWLMQTLAQSMMARDAVVGHHSQAFAGQGDMPAGNPDNHIADMNTMMQAHYGAGRA